MRKVITLSGWSQHSGSLEHLDPGASALDYQSFPSFEACVGAVTASIREVDVIVGWSLGGQVALRLVSEKHINAKHLILLAPPRQYVNDEAIKCGLPIGEFSLFKKQVAGKDANFMKKFQSLITHGDVREKHIKHLPQLHEVNAYKEYWLNYLGEQKSEDINIVPDVKVTFIYGTEDKVLSHEQGKLFQASIPHSKLLLWDLCSHAPHLHNPDAIKNMIVNES